MKRLHIGIFTLLFAVAAHARDINSSMGYSASVPQGWIALTREEVRDNPDLFDFEKAAKNGMPRALLEQVQPMIVSGRADIFLRRDGSASFTDNVNVMKHIGSLPVDADGIRSMCGAARAELSRLFGRPVTVYACEPRRVDGRKALYLDFDGVVPGTRSIQYQFPKSPSVYFVVTATAKNTTLEQVRTDLEAIIRSFAVR